MSKKPDSLQSFKSKLMSPRGKTIITIFLLLVPLIMLFFLLFFSSNLGLYNAQVLTPSTPNFNDDCLNPSHKEYVGLEFKSDSNQTIQAFIEVPKECRNRSYVDPQLYLHRVQDCLKLFKLDPTQWSLTNTTPTINYASGIVSDVTCPLLSHKYYK